MTMKKKKFKNILVNRFAVILPALVLQGIWIYLIYIAVSPVRPVANAVLTILSVVFVLYLVSKPDEPSYKILWIIVMLIFPVLGAVLYLIFGNKATGKPLKAKLLNARRFIGNPPDEICLTENESNTDAIKKENVRIGQTFEFIEKISGFSVLKNESAVYFPSGEALYKDLLEEIKKAEKYIYFEYFIIEDGMMWDSILDILAEKAGNGVDVRVIYDDLGCIKTLPGGYYKFLNSNKIKCLKFNPFKMVLAGRLNNRDHRKIAVIDGKTAYSGGINLADEYINKKEKYGHWKDVGIKITGEGADSFLYMFAEFWDAFAEDQIPAKFLKDRNLPPDKFDGYVMPYYDSPIGKYPVSMMLFTEVLSRAESYAWFLTPYLMINDELYTEFMIAAERGVDVRIIMPGIPDKKVIFTISRSYYGQLLDAGVKIYEYTPGFTHAKACISDDILGSVGSVNLDYRSLFLHFECNSVFYNSSCLADIKKDFIETMSKSKIIGPDFKKSGIIKNIINGILRLIAPLC